LATRRQASQCCIESPGEIPIHRCQRRVAAQQPFHKLGNTNTGETRHHAFGLPLPFRLLALPLKFGLPLPLRLLALPLKFGLTLPLRIGPELALAFKFRLRRLQVVRGLQLGAFRCQPVCFGLGVCTPIGVSGGRLSLLQLPHVLPAAPGQQLRHSHILLALNITL
jgi:hypothetical protein